LIKRTFSVGYETRGYSNSSFSIPGAFYFGNGWACIPTSTRRQNVDAKNSDRPTEFDVSDASPCHDNIFELRFCRVQTGRRTCRSPPPPFRFRKSKRSLTAFVETSNLTTNLLRFYHFISKSIVPPSSQEYLRETDVGPLNVPAPQFATNVPADTVFEPKTAANTFARSRSSQRREMVTTLLSNVAQPLRNNKNNRPRWRHWRFYWRSSSFSEENPINKFEWARIIAATWPLTVTARNYAITARLKKN